MTYFLNFNGKIFLLKKSSCPRKIILNQNDYSFFLFRFYSIKYCQAFDNFYKPQCIQLFFSRHAFASTNNKYIQ